MISSVAKKAKNALTIDTSSTCSDRRSRKNKHSNGVLTVEGRICIAQSKHHRYK